MPYSGGFYLRLARHIFQLFLFVISGRDLGLGQPLSQAATMSWSGPRCHETLI